MAAHDPQVARRLRQLQNSRSLFCSLPLAKAPNDLLDQIRGSLERHSLLQEQPVLGNRSAGAWHLAFRRFVSAAAVIALMGVLGVVVYQIVAPVSPGGTSSVADSQRPPASMPGRTTTPVVMVADAGFTGRLELRTARLVQADAFVARAIENSGLSGVNEPDLRDDKRVYRIAGSREGVNRLVATLSGVWQNFESTTLQVDRPENSATPVVVESVTPEQAVGIVAQNSTMASVQAAASYALSNRMAKSMPGSEIRPLIQYDPSALLAAVSIPRPTETGPETSPRTTQAPSSETAQVNLTIVLLGTR